MIGTTRPTRSKASEDRWGIPEQRAGGGGLGGVLGDLDARSFFGNPSPELEMATGGVGRGCAARPSAK